MEQSFCSNVVKSEPKKMQLDVEESTPVSASTDTQTDTHTLGVIIHKISSICKS